MPDKAKVYGFLFSCLLILFFFSRPPLTLYAASGLLTWENEETGYCTVLEDEAQLLTPEECTQLATQMQAITTYGNAAFKTVSYNNASTAQFARDYYHRIFGAESGTLFLIDMDNREIYIFSDGSIHKTVTNAYANTITDNSYRYASEGDYYRCASTAFEQINTLLSGQRIAQPMKYISNALLALILAALINYSLVRLLSCTTRPGQAEILDSASTKFHFSNPKRRLDSQTKVYNPSRSSGGSGGHSGGGRSGGGGHRSGGGGHRSGGGGGHRF